MIEHQSSPAAARASDNAKRHRLTASSVVVIEDDDDIRALIETVLARAGMTVHTARTASQGIALTTRLHPDIVTIDIGLPDADGLDVAAFLRDLTATRDIPILMISANAQDTQAERARARGAEAYLSKPFRPRTLRAKVAELIGLGDPLERVTTTENRPVLTGAARP